MKGLILSFVLVASTASANEPELIIDYGDERTSPGEAAKACPVPGYSTLKCVRSAFYDLDEAVVQVSNICAKKADISSSCRCLRDFTREEMAAIERINASEREERMEGGLGGTGGGPMILVESNPWSRDHLPVAVPPTPTDVQLWGVFYRYGAVSGIYQKFIDPPKNKKHLFEYGKMSVNCQSFRVLQGE